MTPLGVQLALGWVVPFVLVLGAIAFCPLFAAHWWESNRNKALVAALCSVPVLVYFGAAMGDPGRALLAEKLRDYVSFIVVLAALFTISGGVHVEGSLSGTPLVNTAMLGIGAVLANLAGTTGASALLIRPLLRANRSRRHVAHIVIFFIFIVANSGGLLTPLGDPPLLLGYLNGAPFTWTLQLWPQWLAVNAALLAIFNVWDQSAVYREERQRRGSQPEEVLRHEPLRIRGAHNLVLLLGVLATVVAAGQGVGTGGQPWRFGSREAVVAALAIVAHVLTPRTHRERNQFTFGPIVEVAVLFAGIFVTMAPVLEVVNAWSRGEREVLSMGFHITQPAQFFWATGALSSVLDNAPTYMAFSASAAGLHGVAAHGPFIGALLAAGPEAARALAAIATGAVFMGAMTYIGNAPNFMVRAIAEEHGVRMPSFFGYVAYSAGILLPIFVGVTLLFF